MYRNIVLMSGASSTLSTSFYKYVARALEPHKRKARQAVARNRERQADLRTVKVGEVLSCTLIDMHKRV